jgi:hypothetical protein
LSLRITSYALPRNGWCRLFVTALTCTPLERPYSAW